MMPVPNVLRLGILNLFLCVVFVMVAYFYIDKPVAIWLAHDPTLTHSHLLKFFTFISLLFWGVVCFIYIYEVIRYAYRRSSYFDKVILLLAHSIVIASFFKDVLKLIFGRYWPETFVFNNLSLLRNNVYGFAWFHGDVVYGSFPSGHTTTIVAASTVLWFTYPRWRWVYVLLVILVIIGLIGLDYHFVSDVIAGGFLGWAVAYYLLMMSGNLTNKIIIDRYIEQ